ncbi:ribonuclease HII [Candidatus Kuenenbacteria bacterium]|nr:ribonuclease HII [Candidatus Kuenenbacteria bacterium]
MFNYPNYKIEKDLWKKGFDCVAGLDEAGRGAWAGPVVAAAVILPRDFRFRGLKDSKLLSPQKREELFVVINKNALAIGVGIVSEKIIDNEGIIGATRKAFLEAVEKIKETADYLLVDGIKIFEHLIPSSFHIKGDRKIASVAAASVVAKVTRDHIMKDYHQRYPHYSFDQHKGYGTAEHAGFLEQHGWCDIHRKSFRPVAEKGYRHFEED